MKIEPYQCLKQNKFSLIMLQLQLSGEDHTGRDVCIHFPPRQKQVIKEDDIVVL